MKKSSKTAQSLEKGNIFEKKKTPILADAKTGFKNCLIFLLFCSPLHYSCQEILVKFF